MFKKLLSLISTTGKSKEQIKKEMIEQLEKKGVTVQKEEELKVGDSNKKSKKILFFDDEEMLRSMFEITFNKAGIEFAGYEHPTVTGDPIELVLKEKPDLISTDIIHPGNLSGFDFIKVLKTDMRTKDIPIFVLTNWGQIEDIKKGIALGATDYFVTAMTIPSEFCEAVKSFLTDRDNYKKNIDKLIKE